MMRFETWKKKFKPTNKSPFDIARPDYFADTRYLWSLMDNGNGYYLLSGIHVLDTIGYYITELPYNGKGSLWVNITDKEAKEIGLL